MTTGHIETAVGEILSGDLIEHAKSESVRAVRKYNIPEQEYSDEEGEEVDIGKAAGLVFPVGLSKNYIDHKNTDLEFDIYLSAVLEYMAAETLDLSGKKARDRSYSERAEKIRNSESESDDDYFEVTLKITVDDIKDVFANDEELKTVKERGFF